MQLNYGVGDTRLKTLNTSLRRDDDSTAVVLRDYLARLKSASVSLSNEHDFCSEGKAKSSQHDDGWRLSDAMWAQMARLTPPPKPHPLGCHRPRIPDRVAMDAILLLLRTGMQSGALNATGLCSHSSAHRRFRE